MDFDPGTSCSSANPDRNDYKLNGSVAKDDQHALDCFAKGHVDWAYEHTITYGQWFDRKIWDLSFTAFDQADAGPYVDRTALDHGDHTDLSFGDLPTRTSPRSAAIPEPCLDG